MSRLGKKPVDVPAGVSVSLAGRVVSAKGPKGELKLRIPESTDIAIAPGGAQLTVTRQGDHKQAKANHGLARALVSNILRGVATGFEQRLEIYGTGFNTKLVAGKLHLNIGYSGLNTGGGSQFEIPVPPGIEVVVESQQAKSDTEPAKILIRGCDRQQVGQFSAMVRSLRKTEPYKGKGVRYAGERVVRKQGKALAG